MSFRIEWVLQDFSVEPPEVRYVGGWHATDHDVDEEGQWDSFSTALAWGRERAPAVILSLWVGSPRTRVTYSAGATRWRRFLEWHEPCPEAARVRSYSGLVQITEMPYERFPRETYSLMSETRGSTETEIESGESGLPLHDALELARSRSDFVVVGEVRLPDTYDYYNAGSQPTPAETYPPYPWQP